MKDQLIGAADYARISSDPGNDAKGVARQAEDSATRIAREPGWRHVGSFVDNDLSATKGRARPRFQELMDLVQRGEVQVIVCYMTGRLLRNRRERAEAFHLFAERGVRVVCTGGQDLDFSTPAGRMLAGILGEFDTYEVEQLATRVSDSHQQAVKEGRPIGRAGYGYVPDPEAPKHQKRRLIVPEEAAVIREMRDRIFKGESMQSIARDLNARGVPTAAPGQAIDPRWSSTIIRGIMANPALAGRSTYLGEDVGRAVWEAIISEDDHAKITDLFSSRRQPEGWTNRHVHLLSGIALCGRCATEGRRVTITCRTDRRNIRGYICRDKVRGGCRGLRLKADLVDAYVEETVVRMLGEPGVIDHLVAAGSPDADEVMTVAAAIESCQARATSIGEQMAGDDPDDEITAIARKAALAKINEELKSHRQRQSRLARATVAETLLDVEDVAHHWEHVMTLSQQRATIAALVEITLIPPGRGYHSGIQHVRIDRRHVV